MNSGDRLLDTNFCIALINGDTAAQTKLSALPAVYIPGIVLGELYFGAEKSAKITQNVARVEQFRIGKALIYPDLDTAREYGRLKAGLKRIGRPVPENDLWIASLAVQHNLTLIARDAHFSPIVGLSVEGW